MNTQSVSRQIFGTLRAARLTLPIALLLIGLCFVAWRQRRALSLAARQLGDPRALLAGVEAEAVQEALDADAAVADAHDVAAAGQLLDHGFLVVDHDVEQAAGTAPDGVEIDQDRPVTMGDIRAAAQTEYTKIEKPLSTADTKDWE